MIFCLSNQKIKYQQLTKKFKKYNILLNWIKPILVKYALYHSKQLKLWSNAYSEHKLTLFKHYYFNFNGVLGSRQEK